MTKAAQQPSLSQEFEELWPIFEGERVSKVIMTFAGEVDLSADIDLCQALGYGAEVEFTIRGKVTGKKHSFKGGGMTVGNATVTIESIRANGALIMTKAGERAAKARDVTPDSQPRPIRKDPVWDDIDRMDAEQAEAEDARLGQAAIEAPDAEPFE